MPWGISFSCYGVMTFRSLITSSDSVAAISAALRAAAA